MALPSTIGHLMVQHAPPFSVVLSDIIDCERDIKHGTAKMGFLPEGVSEEVSPVYRRQGTRVLGKRSDKMIDGTMNLSCNAVNGNEEESRLGGDGLHCASIEVLFIKSHFAEEAGIAETTTATRAGNKHLVVNPLVHVCLLNPGSITNLVVQRQSPIRIRFLARDNSEDDDVERPPLEFAAFSTHCRDFIFSTAAKRVFADLHDCGCRRTIALERAEACHQAAEREVQRLQLEQERAEEEAKLVRLQQEDPEGFAKLKLAEREAAEQDKLAKAEVARKQRKAERLRDVEEELAIAKEQQKLDKLAESGDQHEFVSRRELLAARVRKVEERKRHRERGEEAAVTLTATARVSLPDHTG
ncbi:Hypothetical protein PHPALM_1015 [Phytophthora palmivora]|uniref:Uncharacterized protein n=1 Tax=Phytophthora palmivora TaxID=4796 RepID=A0A2P4YTD6_9STRA|nr:Hypothetical protein PHPALM_1015 [Phytophthora palmivora]